MAKKKKKYNERVERIIQFIEKLIVPSGKGAGKPIKLREFQKEFINDIYGKVDKEGNRTVRRAILSIGRKNGKSLLIAALSLVHLVGPEAIMNGEIYSAANDREQAGIIFKYAKQLLREEPELGVLVKIVDSTKTMVSYVTGTIYRAVSAEAGTKYGFNPTVVIYDELAQAKNRELYDALDTSMAARIEPLFVVISTQSKDPQHILSQLIDDGMSGQDPTTICRLYAVPDDLENVLDDEKSWSLANPALGDFRSLSEMRTAAKRAKRMPSFENTFRNLYLNQRVDAQAPFINRTEWVACKGEVELKEGEEVYLGLDLSATTDLTALVAVTAGEKDKAVAWFWKPEGLLNEHEHRDRVPYKVWVKQGFIEATSGNAIEYEYIAEKIRQIGNNQKIVGIAYDNWGMKYMLKAMAKIGLDSYQDGKDKERSGALRLVPWDQGPRGMNHAITALETSILNRKFIHDGNPVLTWNFANAIILMGKQGGRCFDKSKSRFRIDGSVATAMAVGLKYRDMFDGIGPSVYESRGVIVL